MSHLDDLGEPPKPFIIAKHMNVAASLSRTFEILNGQMQYADQLIKAIRADHEDARRSAE